MSSEKPLHVSVITDVEETIKQLVERHKELSGAAVILSWNLPAQAAENMPSFVVHPQSATVEDVVRLYNQMSQILRMFFMNATAMVTKLVATKADKETV